MLMDKSKSFLEVNDQQKKKQGRGSVRCCQHNFWWNKRKENEAEYKKTTQQIVKAKYNVPTIFLYFFCKAKGIEKHYLIHRCTRLKNPGGQCFLGKTSRGLTFLVSLHFYFKVLWKLARGPGGVLCYPPYTPYPPSVHLWPTYDSKTKEDIILQTYFCSFLSILTWSVFSNSIFSVFSFVPFSGVNEGKPEENRLIYFDIFRFGVVTQNGVSNKNVSSLNKIVLSRMLSLNANFKI